MTSPNWRGVAMRDINWMSLRPILGPCVYRLRKLCEPPETRDRRLTVRLAQGDWYGLTLGDVALLDRDRLMSEPGIGPRLVQSVERVIALGMAGQLALRKSRSAA